ncbi:uncharacterized protein [Aristolochia californica]|uniref:uncharacterized protein n=1 Tax=Aristolochia californica TaxID=171875 RepID=UPI0035D66B6F
MIDTHFGNWGPPPFKFNNNWMADPSFDLSLQSFWENMSVVGPRGRDFPIKLKMLKPLLRSWASEKKASSSTARTNALVQIAVLDSEEEVRGLSSSEVFQRYALQGQLQSFAHNKLVHWKQRARFKWLSDGDANTKFFHTVASA